MDSEADSMSSYYYYDKEKWSSSDNNEDQAEDFNMDEMDNENNFEKYFDGYGRESGYISNSLNYPKLRPVVSDEESVELEEEREDEDFGYNNRNITRYPKQRNYEYGIGYGSPPEDEERDEREGYKGYRGSGDYNGHISGYRKDNNSYSRKDYSSSYRKDYSSSYRKDYNSSYSSTYGSYDSIGVCNKYNKRDIDELDNEPKFDNQRSDDSFGFRFRNDDDMPRPYYFGNRYSWVSGHSESSLSGPSTPEPIRGKLSREEGGRVGLRNMGNTCYLNSTLQCLTATIELSYRLAEDFENGKLPDGNKKMFLTSIARLFHEMWQSEGKLSSISRSVAPTQFKNVLGRVDSRFSGYRQEDSQEALAIILDRLHEELKTTSDDSDDDGDDKQADGWEKYCKKENSIVRELFHGQLKSTLECCKCSFKSETFEPFCFLNLPIPVQETLKTIYYKRDYDNINLYDNATVKVKNTSVSSKFNMICFNDKIFNSESSYLIIKRSFKNLNDFKMVFRGAGFWIVEMDENRVIGVKTKLPNISDLKKRCFIAFKAEIMYKNHLVTFVAARSGELVGFPILIRTKIDEILTPAIFIENFLKSTIRSIYVHRFPERLKSFDSTVSLMESSANEYFKVEYIKNDPPDLYHVRVVILNDKSDFNEMIFFKEIDDPTDLFEELCINLVNEDDEREVKVDVDVDVDFNDMGMASNSPFNISPNHYNSPYNGNQYNSPYGSNQYNSRLYPCPYAYTINTNNHYINNPVSLKDCFDKLFTSEKFNEWKCEKCGIPVDAEKRLELWRLPEILILHLKRFSYVGGGAKITKAVDFPLKLELEDSVYDLFGISQHFGSLNFGHYTAILKHEPTGKWFLADDGCITIYENESEWYNEKLKESAYVLFYRKLK